MPTYERKDQPQRMTRSEFNLMPAWAVQNSPVIYLTMYRKPAWAVLSLDEYQRLCEAAGEPLELTQ